MQIKMLEILLTGYNFRLKQLIKKDKNCKILVQNYPWEQPMYTKLVL